MPPQEGPRSSSCPVKPRQARLPGASGVAAVGRRLKIRALAKRLDRGSCLDPSGEILACNSLTGGNPSRVRSINGEPARPHRHLN